MRPSPRRVLRGAFALVATSLILAACSDEGRGVPGEIGVDAGQRQSCAPAERLDCVQECGDDYWEISECVDGRWDCGEGWIPVDSCPPGTDWEWGPEPCDEPAPECVDFCGSDVVTEATCLDGWSCGSGVTVDSCPSDTCWGPPPPNSGCADGEWVCDARQGDFASQCPALLCETCTGFDPAVDTGGCTCVCDADDDVVRCEPSVVETSCETTSTSSLDGVKIELQGPCEWSLDEVASGVSIPYTVVVAAEAEGAVVSPRPLDAGGCGRPDHSGLIPFTSIASPESSGDELWCLCDVGLCPGFTETTTLAAGSYEATIDWSGRTFTGPSDTGNTPGEPFPPGSYLVEIRAHGSRDGVDFEVVATMPIVLTP